MRPYHEKILYVATILLNYLRVMQVRELLLQFYSIIIKTI